MKSREGGPVALVTLVKGVAGAVELDRAYHRLLPAQKGLLVWPEDSGRGARRRRNREGPAS